MEIYIDLTSPVNKEAGLQELRNFLNTQGIKTSTAVKEPSEGEMGAGWIAGIAAILSGGFFGKLGEALVKWVENYRSDLRIKNRFGDEIEISAKMKKEEIINLVEQFLLKSEKIETEKTRDNNLHNKEQ